MTHYFLDSSGILKRYVPETGTGWIRNTLSNPGNTIFIARITPVEIISAVARRQREGSVSALTLEGIQNLLARHIKRDYQIVELSNAVVALAQNLLITYPLRAYDAVQLASAVTIEQRLKTTGLSPLIFVGADARLLSAVTAEALAVENPVAHP